MDYKSTDSVIDQTISFCHRADSQKTAGNDITIREALDEIKGGKYRGLVLKIRELENDSVLQVAAKKSLRGYLFSGMFSVRKADALICYTHMCVLDIDKLTEEEMARHKAILQEDPYVLAYWTSPRGAGLKGLVLFEYSVEPDDGDYAEVHKIAFDEVLDYFVSNYEIYLDTGRDVSRLCFTSYDPELVLKNTFVPFPIPSERLIEQVRQQPKLRKSRSNASVSCTYDESLVKHIQRPSSPRKRRQINAIIKYLEKRNLSITYNYNRWYLVGQAIANEFSYEIGKDYYLRLCRLDGKYHNESESLKKLIECYKKDINSSNKIVSVGSIWYYANQKGYESHKKTPSSETVIVEKI